jgi:hypothetical protein
MENIVGIICLDNILILKLLRNFELLVNVAAIEEARFIKYHYCIPQCHYVMNILHQL